MNTSSRRNPRLGVEAVGHGLVKSALHLDRAASVERDLDDDDVVAAFDAKIGPIDDEVAVRMLGDDLEAIIGGHVHRGDHGVIDDVANGAAIMLRLAAGEIDSDERHGQGLLG